MGCSWICSAGPGVTRKRKRQRGGPVVGSHVLMHKNSCGYSNHYMLDDGVN